MKRSGCFQLSKCFAPVVHATMLITSISLFVVTTSVLADGRKTVHVSVDFENAFINKVRPETLDSISANLAEKFVTTANNNKGFVKWVNCEPAPPDPVPTDCESAPAWKIKVMLEVYEKKVGTRTKKRQSIRIIHEGHLPEDWLTEDVWPDGPPSNNTAELSHVDLFKEPSETIPFTTAAFETKISRDFDPEGINRILETSQVRGRFLELIPLVDNVEIDIDRELVIIPVKPCDLLSGDESQLIIKLLKAGSKKGDMTVNPFLIDEGSDYSNNGLVRGHVTRVRHGEVSGFEEGAWHPKFQTIIQSANEKKVYMKSFSKLECDNKESHGATSTIDDSSNVEG